MNIYTTIWQHFVPDYPVGPVLEETFIHSHPSCLSVVLYQLPLSTTIHSILLVQFSCLMVLFHNLFIFLHLQRSMASSLFSLRAWQSSRTTSFQVLFGLSLGLEPSTSYSVHFFTQSSSLILFATHAHTVAACFAAVSMLCHLFYISQLLTWKSVFYLVTPHIHLTILITAR